MRYQRFLDVSQSADLRAFKRNLIEFGEELGFGLMSASLITELPDKSRSFEMVHNAPDAFSESVTLNEDDARRDPVLQRLKNVSVPFVQPPVGVVGAPTTNRFS